MWFCGNRGFLSAVEDRNNEDYLIVRARRKDHLLNYFPDRPIYTVKDSDYPWRISISKVDYADFMRDQALKITYSNFKNSVSEHELHAFYMKVWFEGLFMQDEQTELCEYYKKAFAKLPQPSTRGPS